MPLLVALATLSAPLPAAEIESAALDYTLVGFDPGAEDEAPRGAELLAAGPGGIAALYNPVDREIVVLDAALRPASLFPVGFASALAWSGAGELLVLDHPARTLHLYSAEGELLDSATLPEIVPIYARLEARGGQVFVVDPLENLHRAAGVEPGALTAPVGPTFVKGDHRVSVRDGDVWADGAIYDGEGAIKIGGRFAGDRWLVIDQIVADAPIQGERYALYTDPEAPGAEPGADVTLPVDGRAYVPRVDVAEDDAGRLLYLDPRADALYLVRVTP